MLKKVKKIFYFLITLIFFIFIIFYYLSEENINKINSNKYTMFLICYPKLGLSGCEIWFESLIKIGKKNMKIIITQLK